MRDVGNGEMRICEKAEWWSVREGSLAQLFWSVRICTDIQQEPRLCIPY